MISLFGLLWLFGGARPASALTHFAAPGCYRLDGRVVEVAGKRLRLRTYEHSRSERVHAIELDEAPVGLRVGSAVRLPVAVDRAGDEDFVKFRARAAALRFVRDDELGARWHWLGARGCLK